MPDGFGEKPHEGETNDWITPRWVIDVFDQYADSVLSKPQFFDLDPCASLTQPWSCARNAYTVEQDGLKQKWFGTVYCNPPYGPNVERWMRRMGEYGDGIALIFARVETHAWQEHIFKTADGILFPSRRLSFARPDGTYASSGRAPSALIAWGDVCRNALITLCDSGGINGAFVDRAFYTGSNRQPTQKQLTLTEFLK